MEESKPSVPVQERVSRSHFASETNGAREFDVPAVESEIFSGHLWPHSASNGLPGRVLHS
jgi:hypothetical protein